MANTVVLVSDDQQLAALCRDVLDEMFGAEWSLVMGAVDAEESQQYDLWIWDVPPGTPAIPRRLEAAQLKTHFFLLNKESLDAFDAVVGSSGLNVLLKPVTRASLRAFLSGVSHCPAGQETGQDSSHTLSQQRDQMLQFLLHANLKLQEYDQERTNFLARCVHDFGAPLTTISGYCALLLEESFGPLEPELRVAIEKIQQSATRLSRLATAMLQLSTGQELDAKPKLEVSNLRDCVDRALCAIAASLERKGIVASVEFTPPVEPLLFERAQIEQVLVNLLENACKFTPRAGTIEVRGYPFFWNRRVASSPHIEISLDRRIAQVFSPNSFRMDIRDFGPDIPASHVEKVFEEDTAYSGGDDRSGGGLGLAICRMVLERHHGRIWAENTPGGAMFSFVLPLPRVGDRESSVTVTARERDNGL